jgi:hypothetical protein
MPKCIKKGCDAKPKPNGDKFPAKVNGMWREVRSYFCPVHGEAWVEAGAVTTKKVKIEYENNKIL